MIKIYEDVTKNNETKSLDRDTIMWLYIDKLAELMRDEPQLDSLVIELEEFQRSLTPTL